jgi:hypothetical protein
MVLGAGLEPASLSAYAPQTYVSASSTTRASRGEFSADGNDWQVSSVFFVLVLTLVIVIEIMTTGVKVFEHEHEHE